jgi:hypothetical protein
MSSFEALYGRKCNTLVSWDNLVDREVVGPKISKGHVRENDKDQA